MLPKGLKVGDTTQIKGKTVKITKVYDSGYNIEEVKETTVEDTEKKVKRTAKKK